MDLKKAALLSISAAPLLLGSLVAVAAQAPQHPMSFFITSIGIGKGGDLGGLAGADVHCQQLATAAGAGAKTWHAYLSTQPRRGVPAVNARDRIGYGPWYNAKGQPISDNLAELHGDSLLLAERGSNLFKQSALTEQGKLINGAGDTPNTHDMLTGSQPDGRAYSDNADHTCNNWTSSGAGSAQVGHSDRTGGGNTSWNSAHATRGCSQQGLVSTGGAGLLYCFAVN
jgi:hypothetical protein